MASYSFNRVILVGNLTRDPELRYTPSGLAVSEIGLAVNDRAKRNDQWVDETTFVDVTLWERTAEVANEYLSKGSQVLIEGRLKLDTWEKDGQKRSKLRVVASKMMMLGGKSGSPEGRGGAGPNSIGTAEEDSYSSEGEYERAPAGGPPSDEIPF